MKENQNKTNELEGTRLSPHFLLGEFLNLKKYPENVPSMQVVVNLTYGCHLLLCHGGDRIQCDTAFFKNNRESIWLSRYFFDMPRCLSPRLFGAKIDIIIETSKLFPPFVY